MSDVRPHFNNFEKLLLFLSRQEMSKLDVFYKQVSAPLLLPRACLCFQRIQAEYMRSHMLYLMRYANVKAI